MAVDLSRLMYANTATPFIDQFNAYKQGLQAQRERDVAEYNKNRDADIDRSNAGYDSTAKQNYINYMQAQKRLPSELNSMGIRGGASESSLIRLGTNYGTNVANNESARQNALTDIRNAYAKQIADYDRDLNDRLASAEATARQNQINWEREQIEKDLEYFSGAIEGLYSSKDGYKKLIAQLRASNDPNKDYKIMLATRAMNAVSGGSGSGGGGSSRSYSSGGYGGYTPITTTPVATNNKNNSTKKTGTSKNSGGSNSNRTKVTVKGDTYYVTKAGSYTKNKKRA